MLHAEWANAGYAGKLAAWAATMKMTIQIVAKRDRHAFEILPRRWVVERTFAWISKHRVAPCGPYLRHLGGVSRAIFLWRVSIAAAGLR